MTVKQAAGPEPCRPIWDEDLFLVFTPKFKGKIMLYLASIVCATPSLGHATPPQHQAVRLINLACPSQEDKRYY